MKNDGQGAPLTPVFHNLLAHKIRKEFNYNASVQLDTTINEMVSWIKPRLREFEYHLDLEFVTERTPKTWTEKLI